MAYPTPIVEIAFDDGPYVLNPTWTDVTQYVWRMDIDRGRSDDWGDFNSFANVTFNNRTRRFDPYYTAGPYYGKLLPRKQIRIRATNGSTVNAVTNPSLTTNTTNWTGNGTTISRITSDYYTSPACLQAVATTTTNARAINGNTTRIPVTVGVSTTVSVYIKCPSVGGNFRFWVNQWSAASGGSPVSTLFSPIQSIGVGVWTLMSYTFTPTQPYLTIENNLMTATIGQVFYVDDLSVTATIYDIFRGYVDGWNPEWTEAGTNSAVTVSCFDALQLLATEQLPADWSRPYILSTAPRHYYPCDEPITAFVGGQTVKDYGSYPLDMTTTTSASQGPELGIGLPSKSIQGTEGNATTSLYGPVIGGTVNISFACWAVFDGGAGGSIGYSVGNAGGYITYDVASAKYQVVVSDNYSGFIRTYTTVNTFDSGTPRFFAFAWNATSKALTLWIDGYAVATTAVATGAIVIILGEAVGFNSAQGQCLIGWDRLITQTEVQNIFNYSSAYFPETTSARFQRIMAETAFPTALTSPASSPVNSVLAITNDAPRISDELRLVAASEGGPLFVSKNGTITMFNQTQFATQTKSVVSQVTYGSGGSKLDPTVSITSDGDSMRNSVFVTMSGGGVYEQTNATSASTYGVASMSLNTQVQTLPNAQSLANIVTGWGGQVYPDLSPAKVVISADGNWGPTLGLELMDRITVNITPPTGNTISTPQLVQRIRHEVVPGLWVTTLDGSARWAAVFIVGQSTIGGTNLLA